MQCSAASHKKFTNSDNIIINALVVLINHYGTPGSGPKLLNTYQKHVHDLICHG